MNEIPILRYRQSGKHRGGKISQMSEVSTQISKINRTKQAKCKIKHPLTKEIKQLHKEPTHIHKAQ